MGRRRTSEDNNDGLPQRMLTKKMPGRGPDAPPLTATITTKIQRQTFLKDTEKTDAKTVTKSTTLSYFLPRRKLSAGKWNETVPWSIPLHTPSVSTDEANRNAKSNGMRTVGCCCRADADDVVSCSPPLVDLLLLLFVVVVVGRRWQAEE